MKNLDFYKDKCVLVTGHTGFKGTWLCKILSMSGAKVVGYALEPPTDPSLFVQSEMAKEMTCVIGDIRDYDKLLSRIRELGLKEEDYSFYLDLRKYGSVRHAGFGLGFERCVMYLTGMSNIRDVVPFPRTVNNCEL